MTSSRWVEPERYYAELAAVHVAALALIRDREGRVLIVKPNYRPHWALPGGMAEDGEPPQVAVAREVKEELGVEWHPQAPVVIDWAAPAGERRRPLVAFVFTGPAVPASVTLQSSELEEWMSADVERLDALLPSAQAARVRTAIAAADSGSTVFLVNGGSPEAAAPVLPFS